MLISNARKIVLLMEQYKKKVFIAKTGQIKENKM